MRSKLAVVAALAIAVVGAAGAGGVGWYYAGEVRNGALVVDRAPTTSDLTVASVTADSITLRVTDRTDLRYGAWRMPGIWGLQYQGGYGQVGDIVALTGDQVVRKFTPVRGTPAVGTSAFLDGAAFDGDPLSARGMPFEKVTFPSELGALGAWQIAGTSRTWAIFIHGKGSTGKEMLRYLPAFASAGLPELVIEYRNDERVAASADGYYDYGASEWRDLDAAARYALAHGADSLVLVGVSMGGAITMSFLDHSDLAASVRAVVLDAPVLSFSDVIDFGGERRNLPAAVTSLGKAVAALRYGFSFDQRDYLQTAAKLKAPILLFHGDADRLVNVRTSDALAKARPDLVTYVRVAGATHVRAWNMDPARYETAVRDFLARTLVSPGPSTTTASVGRE
jgi:pimeloyl-ACP methyl ester carboxylesterase